MGRKGEKGGVVGRKGEKGEEWEREEVGKLLVGVATNGQQNTLAQSKSTTATTTTNASNMYYV